MYLPPFPPPRFIARRRSRCWKCDQKMERRTRRSWWCETCRHTVSYGYQPSEVDS